MPVKFSLSRIFCLHPTRNSLRSPFRYFSTSSSSFIHELQSRGLIYQQSHPNVEMSFTGAYLGIDPTAPSLHVGHLLPMMSLFFAAKHNIPTYFLVGGASALIGDPTGKDNERLPLNPTVVDQNAVSLEKLLKVISRRVMGDSSSTVNIVNNNTWLKDLRMVDFLQQFGRQLRLSTMLGRDSVQNRLNSSTGMAFHEFCYPLLQAYDFFHLHHQFQVNLQLGGSDQWGNMISGLDMIEKFKKGQTPDQVHVITTPLLTTVTGMKFGKSEGNAIWLDQTMTSPFEFYQYFVNSPDDRMDSFLRYFTFLSSEATDEIITEHQLDPSRYIAQKRLASEITKLIHGESGLDQAILATKLFFQKKPQDWTLEEMIFAFRNTSKLKTISKDMILGKRLDDFLVTLDPSHSKESAKQYIQDGGVSVNKKKIRDTNFHFEETHILPGNYIVLLLGRTNAYIYLLH